jgi:hypothetical protein
VTERFSASVAGRHMTCHASANLELAIPGWVKPVEDRTADNAANRGTNMHEMFAEIMRLSNPDCQQMAKAIAYVSLVRSQRRFKVLVEQSIRVEWLITRPWTTVDLVFYTADEIHVLDLKTGVIPVEVKDNEQLMYYGASFFGLAPKAKGIRLHIVQPWANNMESCYVTRDEVLAFMVEAQKAEHAIESGDVSFMPSDHCKFCPAYPHSRAAEKGSPPCPVTLQLLYPKVVNEDEILAL